MAVVPSEFAPKCAGILKAVAPQQYSDVSGSIVPVLDTGIDYYKYCSCSMRAGWWSETG